MITLSAIAYNVNNDRDEVLLAIVCTVYSGNIITTSRLVLDVAVRRAFVALCSSVLVQRQAAMGGCCLRQQTKVELRPHMVLDT